MLITNSMLTSCLIMSSFSFAFSMHTLYLLFELLTLKTRLDPPKRSEVTISMSVMLMKDMRGAPRNSHLPRSDNSEQSEKETNTTAVLRRAVTINDGSISREMPTNGTRFNPEKQQNIRNNRTIIKCSYISFIIE
jgi:hypothetical protein